MRYALRNQDKIAEAYSPDYVKCLIESLDHFFKTVDEDAIVDYWRINTMQPIDLARLRAMVAMMETLNDNHYHKMIESK